MESVILAYSTDLHHSKVSKNLIGVFSDKDVAIKKINKYLKKEAQSELTEKETESLFEINQTQGREENFILEEEAIDELMN